MPNGLHFYVVDVHREDGILSYTLGVRSLEGTAGRQRGVELAALPEQPLPGRLTSLTFTLRNTGAGAGADPALHPRDVGKYLTSDIYGLSVEVDGEGWSARLQNALEWSGDSGGLMKIRILIVPFVWATAMACGLDSGSRDAGTAVVRDSAGVEILEYSLEALEGAPVLSLETTLELGGLSDDPAFQFFQVTDAARLGDGRIAVANSGAWEIRFFSPDGSHLQTVGRQGEGPGEYRGTLTLTLVAGDSLLIFDQRLRRWTILDPDGVVVDVVLPEEGGGRLAMPGAVGESSVLVTSIVIDPQDGDLGREWLEVMRYARDGALEGTVGRVRGRVPSRIDAIRGGVIFESDPSIVTVPGGFVVGDGAPHIDFFDDTGVHIRRVEWPDPGTQVTAEHRERYTAWFVGAVELQFRERRERVLELLSFAERFPAYSEVHAAQDGTLWVREYDMPSDEGPVSWLLFNPRGGLLGELLLPKDSRFLDAGPDWVLLRHLNELEVERIELVRLVR